MKNGQLWYNLDTERVERVVGTLNKTRVFTVSHGYSELKPVKRSYLLKASGAQVEDYMKESAEIKAKALAHDYKIERKPSLESARAKLGI
tara:strand:- start:206 stop:475 length:270 start_codon:yes stop_codon:yes gene_type:complete